MTDEEKLELLKQCKRNVERFDRDLHYAKIDSGKTFPEFNNIYLLREKGKVQYSAIYVGKKRMLYYNGQKAVKVEEIRKEFFTREYTKDEYLRKYESFKLLDNLDWDTAISKRNFEITEKKDEIKLKLRCIIDNDPLNFFSKGGYTSITFDHDNFIKELRFTLKNPDYQKRDLRYYLSDFNKPKFNFKMNILMKEAFENVIAFPDLSVYNLDIYY